MKPHLLAGTARPGTFDPAAQMPTVARTFAFIDMCAFTRFSDTHGDLAATNELRRFRLLARSISAHRGVRIAKWLGDGVLLVGVDPAPTVATAVELVGRYRELPLNLRGGIAAGGALMVDGDDYVGRPLNLASRLCDLAACGEVLMCRDDVGDLPDWVRVTTARPRRVRGLGRVANLARVGLAGDVDLGPPVDAP